MLLNVSIFVHMLLLGRTYIRMFVYILAHSYRDKH